jgi:ABC-type transport system involved in multi-copper enzyme maturation permease subunit
MACEMVVILNAMLWVAPIVQTELEGKTWLYIAARPYGRMCLVVGKLLNGLIWTLGAGLLALVFVGSVALLYARPIEGTPAEPSANEELKANQAEARRLIEEAKRVNPELRRILEQQGQLGPPRRPGTSSGAQFGAAAQMGAPFESIKDAVGVGGILAMLAILAGLTYSSLFCGIGCIIPKRAMLISFSYTLVFEAIVAFVPAIINRLTIQYHLRCLLNRWVDLKVPLQGQELFFSDWPAWWHVAVLVGMIVVWQVVSLVAIHLRQYVLGDEN